MSDPIVYLKPNAIAEPLINQWYAWSYLIPPATAACYITQSHLKVMESFIQAPQVHVTALKDPTMRGGPFIDYPVSNVNTIKALYDRTVEEQVHLLDLYQAIQELDAVLENAGGESLEPLYQHIPAPLKGYVELVYDRYHRPSFRLLEGLLYRSDYYRTDSHAIALYLGNEDDRAFVLSTPRLDASDSVQINLPFADSRWDELFRMRQQGRSLSQIQALFASTISPDKADIWPQLFTPTPPTQCKNYSGNDIRIRYLGHACMLIETYGISILCDPIISYHHQTSHSPRYSFSDLPETIDYVLITHNHQDHIMFESLLQLRHKVKTIIVPKSNKGSLIDPSLKSILNTIGFTNVREIDELENIPVPQGEIVSLPVLGEHGDLNIGAKNAYLVRLGNRSILCAADSNNIDPALYDNLHDIFGDLDILFIGMECEGAPFTWAYESLLGQSLNRRVAETRRLDGSNARRATELVDQLRPQQVYVYAMGQEPWLNFITSIVYTDESIPIIESNKLVQYCQQLDITSERLFGCKEIILEMGSASLQSIGKSRTRKLDTSPQSSFGKTPPQSSLRGREKNTRSHSSKNSMNNTQQNGHQESNPGQEQRRAIATFLSTLAQKDIRLWIEEDGQEVKLRCNAPKGVLTQDLQTQIKTQKPEIIAFLQRQKGKLTQTKTLDLPSEVQLDPAINPQNCNQESANQINLSDPSTTLLLTGANGFMGSFILFELLKQTSAQIYCLVRAETDTTAFNRIRSSLEDYYLWEEVQSDHSESRIIALAGDLSQSKFGLSSDKFTELSQNIDIIYHNGAWVHHGSPYSLLKPTNVLGTQEILRLACTEKIKPVHFVSTISVFPLQSQNPIIYEQDSLANYTLPSKGYAQTKWVAESMMAIAHERGLPVSIYRLGPISGHSQTGVFNANDFLYRLMMGYIQLGSAPDGEVMLDVLPVDYASQALVYLSLQPSELPPLIPPYKGGSSDWPPPLSKGRAGVGCNAFHLLHAAPVTSEILFNCIQRKGYDIQRIPYDQWRKKLLAIAQSSPDHHLYPLVALFPTEQTNVVSSSDNALVPVEFDCQNAIAGLQNSNLSCPAIDEKLLDTYLSYLIKTNQIQPPNKSPCRLG